MGKKILIADDEPNIVVSLEFLMKQRASTSRSSATARRRSRRSTSSRPIWFCST